MRTAKDCCRHAKITRGKVRSVEDHNRRTGKLPKNVDLERSKLNKRIFDGMSEATLKAELVKRIEEAKTFPNRGKVGVAGCQKNTPWCGEILCYATEKAFRVRDAEGNPTEEYDMPKIREHSKLVRKWFRREFGDNLISIDLHMDEAEPHWHGVVAFKSPDGKYNAKAIFGGPAEMRARQTRYWEECGKPLGMDRGVPGGKRAHTTIKEYQARMDAAKGDAAELMAGIENPPMIGKAKWREETHRTIEGVFTAKAKAELELEQARAELAYNRSGDWRRAKDLEAEKEALAERLKRAEDEIKKVTADLEMASRYHVAQATCRELKIAFTERKKLEEAAIEKKKREYEERSNLAPELIRRALEYKSQTYDQAEPGRRPEPKPGPDMG